MTIRSTIARLLAAVGLLGGVAVAQAQVVPPDSTTCPTTVVLPTTGGTNPGAPGTWWNPNRYGTGWRLVFATDTNGQQLMTAAWFTFDANHRPIWLWGPASPISTTSTGETVWQSLLYKTTFSYVTHQKTETPVGSVAVTFPKGAATRAALRWQWDSVDTQQHDECIYDNFRDPSQTGGQTNTPEPTSANFTQVNESYTGVWSSSVAGWGVYTTIGIDGSGNYTEVEDLAIFDHGEPGQPVWVHGEKGTGTSPPSSAQTSIPTYFIQSLYNAPTAPCTGNADGTQNCVSRTALASNSYQRSFADSLSGTAWLAVSVAAAGGWPGIQFMPTGDSVLTSPASIYRITDNDSIVTSVTTCQTPDGQTNCSFKVSWSSADGGGLVYRRNLTTNVLGTTALGSGQTGEITESLPAGSYVRYELVEGYTRAVTASVRVVGPNNLPDAPQTSLSGDLPAHDPTVGTVQGEASVEGGGAAYRIPLVVPPGRAGMEPQLALTYSSRAGNGTAGLGWSLSGVSAVHRCPRTADQDGKNVPVRYAVSDRLCLDGQRLVPMDGNNFFYGTANKTYRTEINDFSRITQIGADLVHTGSCFKVELKSGRILHFGGVITGSTCATDNSSSPAAGTTLPLTWRLAKVEDRLGNTIIYKYDVKGSGEVVLSEVDYTGFGATAGNRVVTFSYSQRPSGATNAQANDWSSSYLAGGLSLQGWRLDRADTYVGGTGGEHVRSYKLDYTQPLTGSSFGQHSGRSLLASVTECAYDPTERCKNPTKITWSDLPVDHKFHAADFDGVIPAVAPDTTLTRQVSRVVHILGDFDGDGAREAVISQLQAADAGETGPHRHYWMVGYTADRKVLGSAEITDIIGKDSGDVDERWAADIDSDGRSDFLVYRSTSPTLLLFTWKSTLQRGALWGSGATGTSLFQQVTTNIPAGVVTEMADFDGDGHVDVAVLITGTSCAGGVNVGSGTRVLCVFSNSTKAPIGAGTSYTFAAGVQVDTVTSGLVDVAQKADINGDGIPDIFFFRTPPTSSDTNIYIDHVLVSTPDGVSGIAACPGSAGLQYTSCTATQIGLANDIASSPGLVRYWIDVNGDGLVDNVFGTRTKCNPADSSETSGVAWCIQLNKGQGFGAVARVSAAYPYGLAFPGVVEASEFRYAQGRLPVADVDSDGHPEILYPTKFAARMCVHVTYSAPSGNCNDAYTGNTSVSNPDVTAQCTAWACPEDPGVVGGNMPTNLDDRVVKAYSWTAPDGKKFGWTDTSSYEFAAVRFTQTGANSFTATSVSLDATSPTDPSRAAHKVIGTLTGAYGVEQQDLYGDGMPDLFTQVGCQWRFPAPTCVAVTDGGRNPATLPDGTSVSTLTSSVKMFVNENVGSSENPGYAPFLPELVTGIVNGQNDQLVWSYAPLSANGIRIGSSNPLLYTLGDPSYVADSRHFFFASSMPVVASMIRTSDAGGVFGGGFRSFVYGYEGAIYNHLGRGFQGFRKILTQQFGTGSDINRVVRTETLYNQKFPLAGKVDTVSVFVPPTTVNNPPSGATAIPLSQQNYVGSLLSKHGYAWICRLSDRSACDTTTGAAPTDYPTANSEYVYEYDLAGAEAGAQTQVKSTAIQNYQTGSAASAWDTYGNLTYRLVTAADLGNWIPVAAQSVETATTYQAADTTAWWLDRLQSRSVTTKITQGANHAFPAALTAPVAQTVSTSYAWNTDRTPQSETTQPSQSTQTSTKTYTYPSPSYGVPSTVTLTGYGISPTRSTTFGFSADNYFVTSSTQVSGAALLVTQVTPRARDGLPSVVTDPNGMKTTPTYDAFGRVTRIDYTDTRNMTREPSTTVAWNRCTAGSCPGVGEGSSGESLAAYRVTTVKDGAPTRVSWFNALDHETKSAWRTFDGTFAQKITYYDRMGTVSAVSSPFFLTGQINITEYDAQFAYDRLGRMKWKFTPASDMDSVHGDMKTTYTYADSYHRVDIAVNNRNAVCNAPDVCPTMSRYFDAAGKLTRTVDALGGITDYWYDGAGHPVAIQDAKGQLTSAVYNELGFRTSMTDPNMGTTGAGTYTFNYNALGELTSQTDPRGATLTVTSRDALGRVLQQTSTVALALGMGTETINDSWTYDAPGALGQVSSIQRLRNGAAAWKEDYTYDYAERVATITNTIELESTPLVTRFAYDTYYGREKARTYPDGLRVQSQYNVYGMPQQLSDPDSLKTYWTATGQDPWGHVTAESFGNGTNGSYAYFQGSGQAQSRQWSGAGLPLDKFVYKYDSVGNLLEQDRTLGSTTYVETFAYDAVQRLTQSQRTGSAAITYGYDAIGNFTFKSDFSAATPGAYTYDTTHKNRVASVTLAPPVGGTATYTYDANGNLIGGNQLQAAYDANNLLRRANRGAQFSIFQYTPTGDRYQEVTSSNLRTVYLPAGLEKVVGGAAPLWRHELGPAVVVRQSGANDVIAYVARDRLGSGVSLLGGATSQRSYDAFGKPRNGDFTDGAGVLGWTPTTTRGFTGHENLDEVRLIHMNGRAYDYAMGRFLSVDPLIQFPEDTQSLNPYAYVLNNPLSGVDPSGYACGGPNDKSQGIDCEHGAKERFVTSSRMDIGYVSIGSTQPIGLTLGSPRRDAAMIAVRYISNTMVGKINVGSIPGWYVELEARQAIRTFLTDIVIWGGRALARTAPVALALVPSSTSATDTMDAWNAAHSGDDADKVKVASPPLAGVAISTPAPGSPNNNDEKDPKPLLLSPRILLSRQGQNEMTGSRVQKLQKLMKMKGYGDLPPIEVARYEGRYIIIDGHHRAAAAVRAGLKEVPVVVRQVGSAEGNQLLQEAAEAASRRF